VASQPDARPTREHRDQQGEPVGVDPHPGPAGVPVADRGDQRLDLDEERSAALQGGRDDAARRDQVVLDEEGAGRVGQLGQPELAHLEHADLFGRAVAVLRGPQQSQPRRPVALKPQDGIDQVLEGLRPGDRPVLGHVADEDHGDAIALGQVHQP
jgi:hypothetical protein